MPVKLNYSLKAENGVRCTSSFKVRVGLFQLKLVLVVILYFFQNTDTHTLTPKTQITASAHFNQWFFQHSLVENCFFIFFVLNIGNLKLNFLILQIHLLDILLFFSRFISIIYYIYLTIAGD